MTEGRSCSSYFVGGLREEVSPEEQQAKLNECARRGWELVQVVFRGYQGAGYTFFYFKKATQDTQTPRFNLEFSE